MSSFFKDLARPTPFRLGTSRQDIVAHPAWQRARQECLATLAEGGQLTLGGAPGTGKTLLLQDLCATLRAAGHSALLMSFGNLDGVDDDTAVLLIDEADRLSREQISQLRLRPGPLVLAGLPTLRERVADSVGLIGHVALEPMTKADVAQVVVTRLETAGRLSTTFAPDAIDALAVRSEGLFRLVIILSGAALFFADLRGADRVSAVDVDEAAAMRDAVAAEAMTMDAAPVAGAVASRRSSPWPRRVVIAMLAMVAAIGAIAHLSEATGGSAEAADNLRGGGAVVEVVQQAVPPPRPLTPKHALAVRN